MEYKVFDLYLGLKKSWADLHKRKLVQVLKDRYPDAHHEEILDGYWAGVEETTLLYKVETTQQHLLETVELLRDIKPDVFVTFDDDNI